MKYKFEEIAINSTTKKKPVDSDKFHYIGLEHLDSQSLQVVRFGSEVAPKGEKLIMKKGDVLFGKRRAYQKKVGIAPFDGIFSAHGMVLRPNEKIVSKSFFPFFISSDYFLDKAISISVGSLSPTINWSDLKVLEFDLPSLVEQERLAKILWKIEEMKSELSDIIQKNTCLKRSVFLDLKNINKYKIKDIANCYQPSNIDKKKISNLGKYKLYGANGVIGLAKDYNFQDEKLILGCRGTCGSVYITSKYSWITSNSMVIENKENIVLRDYLYYYFKYNDLSKIITGTAQPQIVRNVLYEFEIKLPEIELQKIIVNKIRQIEKMADNINDKKIKIVIIQKQILKEAFNV